MFTNCRNKQNRRTNQSPRIQPFNTYKFSPGDHGKASRSVVSRSDSIEGTMRHHGPRSRPGTGASTIASEAHRRDDQLDDKEHDRRSI